MQKAFIPEGYQQVMPYLIVKDASRFSNFIRHVFDAEEKYKVMRDEHLIAHGELKIGDGVIMFADATEQFEPCTAGVFVYVADADEVYHKAIEHGATSVMMMSDQPYGRSGGVKDEWGNVWWVTSVSEVSGE